MELYLITTIINKNKLFLQGSTVLNACFCTVTITAHLSAWSAKNRSCVCVNALPLLLFSLSWARIGLFTLLSSKNTYKNLGTLYTSPSYNSIRSGQARKISDTVATVGLFCWFVAQPLWHWHFWPIAHRTGSRAFLTLMGGWDTWTVKVCVL